MAKGTGQEVRTYYFPKNFDAGQKLFDMFDIRGVVEGVVLFVPFWFVLPYVPVHGTGKLCIYIVVIVICIFLGVLGFNGEHLSEFIKTLYHFSQDKKIGYYNPRAKVESKPDYLEEAEKQMPPRDRLLKLIGKDASQEEEGKPFDYSSLAFEQMFFEDDLGIVEKPDALKTPADRRNEQRAINEKKRQLSELERWLKKEQGTLEKEAQRMEAEKARISHENKQEGFYADEDEEELYRATGERTEATRELKEAFHLWDDTSDEDDDDDMELFITDDDTDDDEEPELWIDADL